MVVPSGPWCLDPHPRRSRKDRAYFPAGRLGPDIATIKVTTIATTTISAMTIHGLKPDRSEVVWVLRLRRLGAGDESARGMVGSMSAGSSGGGVRPRSTAGGGGGG